MKTEAKNDYHPDIYWEETGKSYPYYPSVKHRTRFILGEIGKLHSDELIIFDYGCGEGSNLLEISERFSTKRLSLSGCDISGEAIHIAQKKLPNAELYADVFPEMDYEPNCIICSEVLEHTEEYEKIFQWFALNLKSGGKLILTTQAGKIHMSDKYTGHTQHFSLQQLELLLKGHNFRIESKRYWGWPFFSLQKMLTNINFKKVRSDYLEGEMNWKKKVVFSLANGSYYIHDFIGAGPQIYLTAVRR